jgi:hypothetical protein
MSATARRAAVALAAAFTCIVAVAQPLVAGATLPALEVLDQHDRPFRVEAGTRLLVFAADKGGSDLVQDELRRRPPDTLARLQAVHLADISAMPSLVTRMVALPRLRELPFRIGLVRDARLTADLPRQPAQVTVLTLDQGVVRQVVHAADPPALRRSLGLGSD